MRPTTPVTHDSSGQTGSRLVTYSTGPNGVPDGVTSINGITTFGKPNSATQAAGAAARQPPPVSAHDPTLADWHGSIATFPAPVAVLKHVWLLNMPSYGETVIFASTTLPIRAGEHPRGLARLKLSSFTSR